MPVNPVATHAAGQVGPGAYTDWRSTSLGSLTETIERRLILRLAGEVEGRSVLDVGCGDGGLALAFWRSGAGSVAGCDIDQRMIAQASAEAAHDKATIGYVLAEAERLPYHSESFDLVTIITALAFLPQPERAVREIARVLRPGGRLILGDLGKWSLWAASRRLRGWLGLTPLWKAAQFRSAGELCALAQTVGLQIGQVAGAIYYPRYRWLARLMAPIDPFLGRLTTFGAAFVAIEAAKDRAVPG